MAERKAPLRTCAGCRGVKEKSGLIRIVRTPEGYFQIPSATGVLHQKIKCSLSGLEIHQFGTGLTCELALCRKAIGAIQITGMCHQ